MLILAWAVKQYLPEQCGCNSLSCCISHQRRESVSLSFLSAKRRGVLASFCVPFCPHTSDPHTFGRVCRGIGTKQYWVQ